FAIAKRAGPPERVLVIENDPVADVDAAVARYLEETGARPRAATLAVAGPVDGEEIALTNRTSWRLRRREFAKRFGFSQLRVLNDFEAIAWALPRLGAAQTRPLGKPVAGRAGVKVGVGPGPGLGAAAPLPAGGRGHVGARADMPRSARRRRTRSRCSRGFARSAGRSAPRGCCPAPVWCGSRARSTRARPATRQRPLPRARWRASLPGRRRRDCSCACSGA